CGSHLGPGTRVLLCRRAGRAGHELAGGNHVGARAHHRAVPTAGGGYEALTRESSAPDHEGTDRERGARRSRNETAGVQLRAPALLGAVHARGRWWVIARFVWWGTMFVVNLEGREAGAGRSALKLPRREALEIRESEGISF